MVAAACWSTPAEYLTLQPGELWFGEGPVCLHTLLGSCIALTLWHPRRCFGGMCHYLLAAPGGRSTPRLDRPGYFATGALDFFQAQLRRFGSHPDEVEIKMFGGGNMFHHLMGAGMPSIASSNIQRGTALLAERGFKIHCRDVGGNRYRSLNFELWNGSVKVRYGPHPNGRQDSC